MRRVPVVVLVLFALASTSCGLVSEAAARVNGEKITQSAVEAEVSTALDDPRARESIRQQGLEPLGSVRRSVLSSLVILSVKRQAARELGVEVTEERILQEIQTAEQQQGGPEALDEFLAERNLTRAQLPNLFERALLDQDLQRAVTEDLDVPEDVIRQSYERSKSAFTEVELRQIIVGSEDEAVDVLRQLDEGADFTALAQEVSTVDQVDVGSVPLQQLPPTERGQFEGVAEGGYVGPIPLPEQQVAVFQVVERTTQSLEEVRDQIVDSLLSSRRSTRFGEWVEERVQAADIVVNPKYGRLDPEAVDQLSEQITGGVGGPGPVIISTADDIGD